MRFVLLLSLGGCVWGCGAKSKTQNLQPPPSEAKESQPFPSAPKESQPRPSESHEVTSSTEKFLISPCLEPNQVVAGVAYHCADGSTRTGTYVLSGPESCSNDGQVGCVATDAFPAIEKSRLTPGVLKVGQTLAGVTGNFPSATSPLPGASATDDLTSLAATTPAGSYEFFDSSGQRYTGSITDAGTINIGATAQTYGTSLYRGFTVPGDPDLVAENLLLGVSLFGITGNVVLPAAADVRDNVSYGVARTSLGSYLVADCTSDGQVDCKIPSSGTFKAADTTHFSGWDIRRKRSSSGAVLTFAGYVGQSKTCRNRSKSSTLDNTTLPAITGLDIFDTTDDAVVSFLPSGEVPPWTITGVAGDPRGDFKCGGIVSTGGVATGNTGADASIPHDPDGNWQDLTPTIVPGGASSGNLAGGCNATDKLCVFRELISGMMITERMPVSSTWTEAIAHCDKLGEPGGLFAGPIPVVGGQSYSDWRLPTQKEVLHLYNAGILGLNVAPSLVTNFGDFFTDLFWNSSSRNASTSRGYQLSNIYYEVVAKGASNPFFCVR